MSCFFVVTALVSDRVSGDVSIKLKNVTVLGGRENAGLVAGTCATARPSYGAVCNDKSSVEGQECAKTDVIAGTITKPEKNDAGAAMIMVKLMDHEAKVVTVDEKLHSYKKGIILYSLMSTRAKAEYQDTENLLNRLQMTKKVSPTLVAGDILIFLFFSLTIWKRSAMLWIEKMLALERVEC